MNFKVTFNVAMTDDEVERVYRRACEAGFDYDHAPKKTVIQRILKDNGMSIIREVGEEDGQPRREDDQD